MELYLEQYYDLLINTKDIEVIKEFLPSITLDKTNEILNQILLRLNEEYNFAVEYGDLDYQKHLQLVINLVESVKEKEPEPEPEISVLQENILIFDSNFLKSVKSLEDSVNYKAILTAIESLQSKEWMANNMNNPTKYKRLHGVARGLSEVKVFPLRLLHTKINEDFWYVAEVMDKEGDNTKKQQEALSRICTSSKARVTEIKKSYKVDEKLDYEKLKKYAEESKEGIMEELRKWEARK